MIKPREYQLESLQAVIDKRDSGVYRQLISLPTGTGKTVIFSLLVKELGLRTLIVAHAEELIAQAISKIKMVWPEVNVGVIKAEREESNAQVVVASIQTISREKRLKKLQQQDFGLMIIDEAHHATADSYQRVIQGLGFFQEDPYKLLVGVTATPKRADGVGLGSIFQEIVFERSISTMIRGGYLSPLVGKQVITKTDLRGVGVAQGDFIASQLSKAINMPARNELIVDNFKIFAYERKKAIAFCADVQHAKDLANAFTRNGIPAKAIFGSMGKEERKQTLQDFAEGKFCVLTNCAVLVEGFDEASIDTVILARPTASSSFYTQMIGRGTRLHPAKRDCLILDFCDNSDRHDLCNYKNTLDGDVACLFDATQSENDDGCKGIDKSKMDKSRAPNEARVCQERIEEIEFFQTAYFAWTPVGDSWHLHLANERDVWVRQVEGGFLVVAQDNGDVSNLSDRPLSLDYALGIAEDWSRKQTTQSAWARKDAEWRKEPATQKQMETLTKLGMKFDQAISKGEASQLLDKKFNEPATIKQLWWLKSRGIAIDPSITKMQARAVISKNK